MSRVERILLAVDFAPTSERAIAFTAVLARALNAPVLAIHIDVLHGQDDTDVEADEPDPSRSTERIHQQLGAIASRLRAEGVDVEVRCRRSLAIAPSLLETADEGDVTLLIAGTHGRRGMRRFLLGSVTDELLRTSHFPLILVPHQTGSEVRPVRRLLVPVDFSASSDHQLQAAGDLARALDAEVELLHVKEPVPIPFMLPGIGTLSDLVPALSREIESDLETRAAALQESGCRVKTTIVDGRAEIKIVDVAERDDSDLIVIARHGLSKVERVLLGSITERVARSTQTPVLIFPDPRTT